MQQKLILTAHWLTNRKPGSLSSFQKKVSYHLQFFNSKYPCQKNPLDGANSLLILRLGIPRYNVSLFKMIFLYIFKYIIFLIWIETLFDDFLITQIVLISIGSEPKGDWGRWRAGGPWLESRQFLEIELTVTAGIIITPGENRVGGFPMTLSKKKTQSDSQILFRKGFWNI